MVCLGDSLTAGYGLDQAQAYPALLQKSIDEPGLEVQSGERRSQRRNHSWRTASSRLGSEAPD